MNTITRRKGGVSISYCAVCDVPVVSHSFCGELVDGKKCGAAVCVLPPAAKRCDVCGPLCDGHFDGHTPRAHDGACPRCLGTGQEPRAGSAIDMAPCHLCNGHSRAGFTPEERAAMRPVYALGWNGTREQLS